MADTTNTLPKLLLNGHWGDMEALDEADHDLFIRNLTQGETEWTLCEEFSDIPISPGDRLAVQVRIKHIQRISERYVLETPDTYVEETRYKLFVLPYNFEVQVPSVLKEFPLNEKGIINKYDYHCQGLSSVDPDIERAYMVGLDWEMREVKPESICAPEESFTPFFSFDLVPNGGSG